MLLMIRGIASAAFFKMKKTNDQHRSKAQFAPLQPMAQLCETSKFAFQVQTAETASEIVNITIILNRTHQLWQSSIYYTEVTNQQSGRNKP